MDSIIRGANWYCRDINQRIRTEEFKLPVLSRDMQEYAMGGGLFSVELPGHVKPLEAEVEINGSHGDLRGLFGREPGHWITFAYYERLLNIFPTGDNDTPVDMGRVVIMKGLLNEVTQSSVKLQKASGTTKYKWGSIILYHDMVDGATVHKFDVRTNKLVMNGVNYSAQHNQLLRI